MSNLKIIHAPADTVLAARLRDEIQADGFSIVDTVGQGNLSLVILSPGAWEHIESDVINALDSHHHLVVVKTAPIALPALIGHIQAIDFSRGHQSQAVLRQLKALSGENAPLPITVLTPTKRAENQRFAMGIGVVVFILFAVGIYMIAVLGYGPPEDEFASVETQIFLTRNYFIDAALPRTTEDAANFELTYERARPSLQPHLAATATAIHEGVQGTFVPQTTAEAENFEATLRFISTVVREDFLATVTAASEQGE